MRASETFSLSIALSSANNPPRSPSSAFQAAVTAQLRETKLEWNSFPVGFFLDYYGLPKVKTHLPMLTVALDLPHGKAGIPGTSDAANSFT
ncbi:hypothetical protein BN1708_000350 [Verticillium longisporum]|uniref:Uncharacterized protein n=1 Tax=Verticillium longisporum TaxID=100787 RepID=A0A0G4KDE4_VERLO|nr:hypothetical protein HYQ44_008842 [Verticillium longisporum]CRJ80713.1 hypothetical protein BN1708_000350 [Verticillium longisporum]